MALIDRCRNPDYNGDIGGRLALQYTQQIRVIFEIAALVTHLNTVTE